MPTPSLTALSREALLERWQEISSDHDLVEAPERIETDAYGNILMSPPPDGDHQKRSYRITRLFEDLLPGDGAVTERSVLTDQGIKIPDVIWLNPSRAHEIHGTKPIEPAPDICVEVRSPGNSLEELAEKKAAYFRAGAREVWMCDQNSMLTDSASEFLPELADFYAFPAEIRNCPGVTPMIRLK
jgi:Uma2 family endonuclease